MKLAICYARVSTPHQTMDAQVQELLTYCQAEGLQLARIIREEPIGGDKHLRLRPGGKKLLMSLDEGEGTEVVAFSLDRLFRSLPDTLEHLETWDKAGITLHLCDIAGTSLSTNSAMGRVMLTLMASIAQFEKEKTSERTVLALAHKKRNLEVYNQIPYGFIRDGKKLVPLKREQSVLAQIFEWRQNKMTLYQIAEKLNKLSVPTKKGKRWHSETIRQILRNDIHHACTTESFMNCSTGTPNDVAESKNCWSNRSSVN